MDFESAMQTFAEAWMAANEARRRRDDKEDEIQPDNESTPSPSCRAGPSMLAKAELMPEELDEDEVKGEAGNQDELRPKLHRPFEDAQDEPDGGKVVVMAQIIEEDIIASSTTKEYSVGVPCSLPMANLVSYVLGHGDLRRLRPTKAELIVQHWKPLVLVDVCDLDCSVIEVLGQLRSPPTLKIVLNTEGDATGNGEERGSRLMSLMLEHYYRDLHTWKYPTALPILELPKLMPSVLSNSELSLPNWSATSEPAIAIQPSPVSNTANVKLVSELPKSFSSSNETKTPLPGGTRQQNSGNSANNTVVMKPRMRICFDPETEIPRLQRWFAQNQHPTRQQVEEYVRELNSLDSRRGRKPLDVNNVIYWFKNTRAAVKRTEMKSNRGEQDQQSKTLTNSASNTSWPWMHYGKMIEKNEEHQASAIPPAYSVSQILATANLDLCRGPALLQPSSQGMEGSSSSTSLEESPLELTENEMCLKRKRNRTFIDPVSEVPRLESWFMRNTHPSHAAVAKFTQELNNLPYRQKFPKLEQKNIQFWFKNRRAKCKRLSTTNAGQHSFM